MNESSLGVGLLGRVLCTDEVAVSVTSSPAASSSSAREMADDRRDLGFFFLDPLRERVVSSPSIGTGGGGGRSVSGSFSGMGGSSAGMSAVCDSGSSSSSMNCLVFCVNPAESCSSRAIVSIPAFSVSFRSCAGVFSVVGASIARSCVAPAVAMSRSALTMAGSVSIFSSAALPVLFLPFFAFFLFSLAPS